MADEERPAEKVELTELEQLVEDERERDRASGFLPAEKPQEASDETDTETEEASGKEVETEEDTGKEAAETAGEEPEPTTEEPEQNLDYWKQRATKAEGDLRDFASLVSSAPGDEPTDIPAMIQELGIDDDTDPVTFATKILEANRKLQQSDTQRNQTVERLRSSHTQARTRHDGKDGWPSYDELYDEQLAPLFKEQPKAMRLLSELPDSGEASYLLGFLLKYDMATLESKIKDKYRGELLAEIEKQSQSTTRTPRGTRTQVEQSVKNDLMGMSDAEFEDEIAKAKLQPHAA